MTADERIVWIVGRLPDRWRTVVAWTDTLAADPAGGASPDTVAVHAHVADAIDASAAAGSPYDTRTTRLCVLESITFAALAGVPVTPAPAMRVAA